MQNQVVVLVILTTILVGGCGGASEELSRSEARELIQSSDLLMSGKALANLFPKEVLSCLDATGLKEKRRYAMNDIALKYGFEVRTESDFNHVLYFDAPEVFDPAVEVTGVRNFGNGNALVKFTRNHGHEIATVIFRCLAPNGNTARFAVYDDGWRVEEISFVDFD